LPYQREKARLEEEEKQKEEGCSTNRHISCFEDWHQPKFRSSRRLRHKRQEISKRAYKNGAY
jgi:hypothetical protein